MLFLLGVVGTALCMWGYQWRAYLLADFGLTVKIPDLTHLMSPAYLSYFGWELGELGRDLYVKTQLSLDMLAIVSYVMLLVSMAHFFALGSVKRLLMKGVFLAAFFDVAENLLAVFAIMNYPELVWLATPITICTSLKAFFLVVSGCILIPLTILGTLENLKKMLKTLSKKRA